jgi:hypothetical protein
VNLVLRLGKIAAAHGHSIDVTESGWTASPTSVSLFFELNNTFTDNYQVDCLQTNGYDCGVWVLASIAAVLRGFDVTGFSETDIPWFRQFIMYHVLSLPVSS